jgi:CHASE1-domain containing sensor protein
MTTLTSATVLIAYALLTLGVAALGYLLGCRRTRRKMHRLYHGSVDVFRPNRASAQALRTWRAPMWQRTR